MKNVLAKLLQFQKKVGIIIKDETNPFFKSKYADINGILAEIRPVLNDCNLLIMQPIITKEGKNYINTIVADADSGEMLENQTELPAGKDAQATGAIITYYRRYALQSLLLLQAEDDDGNSAIITNINQCKTQEELRIVWSQMSPQEQEKYFELKENLKNKLK